MQEKLGEGVMLAALIFYAALMLPNNEPDIRTLLRDQGFEWTLETADSRIEFIGDIPNGKHTYYVYSYNGVNRENSHGINRIIVILDHSQYVGSYESSSARDCRVRVKAVVCETDYPGRRIEFSANGPPAKAWLDGQVVSLELPPR